MNDRCPGAVLESLGIQVLHHPNGIAEIVVSGRLSLQTVTDLRRTVHKGAAEMASALVLDLNAVTGADDVAVLAIPTLQRYCADLAPPMALVVHAGPSSPAARVLRGVGIRTTVFADLQSAADFAIAAGQPWPTARLFLPPSRRTAVRARRFVCRVCQGWSIPWVGHRAALIVGELVDNATMHAPGPAHLTMSLGRDRLHVSVRDGSKRLPTARLAAIASPDRGLGVVELASVSWGTFLLHQGKTVWAEVSLQPE